MKKKQWEHKVSASQIYGKLVKSPEKNGLLMFVLQISAHVHECIKTNGISYMQYMYPM